MAEENETVHEREKIIVDREPAEREVRSARPSSGLIILILVLVLILLLFMFDGFDLFTGGIVTTDGGARTDVNIQAPAIPGARLD